MLLCLDPSRFLFCFFALELFLFAFALLPLALVPFAFVLVLILLFALTPFRADVDACVSGTLSIFPIEDIGAAVGSSGITGQLPEMY